MRPRPQALPWRAVCPPTWPVWARRWAASAGSLTVRLKAIGPGFAVSVVRLGFTQLRKRPGRPAQCTVQGRCAQRCVVLSVADVPLVLAQTVMWRPGKASDWPFWQGLGSRSLGSVLFTDPSVRRGTVYFRKLPLGTPWVMDLINGPAMRGDRTRCLAYATQMNGWFARSARFERGSGQTPLWVMEVFLPTLQTHQDVQ